MIRKVILILVLLTALTPVIGCHSHMIKSRVDIMYVGQDDGMVQASRIKKNDRVSVTIAGHITNLTNSILEKPETVVVFILGVPIPVQSMVFPAKIQPHQQAYFRLTTITMPIYSALNYRLILDY